MTRDWKMRETEIVTGVGGEEEMPTFKLVTSKEEVPTRRQLIHEIPHQC